MSAREQMELDVVGKVVAEMMTRKQAEQILNVSERTLRRYIKGYLIVGVQSIKHGNCNKAPVNRHEDELKMRVQDLVREKYFDFNMTHCLEKLVVVEGIRINRETFRRWCHEIEMVKRAKKRRGKARKHRQRMQQTGLMLQMDGSPHAWFGGKPSCLIGAIDDADSNVPYAEFFPAEDTLTCMVVLQRIIEKKGIFQILYVDRAGIFGGPKRAQFSQVKRALKELGIHVIFANSPEAKGRIERLWGTLQDRLIPEMRLRNIRSYSAANHFLQEQFLPNEYVPKFTVTPENLQTAYKPLPTGINLNEIFCLKEYRQVKRDHTFSWGNDIYQIDSPLKHSIYKQKIEVRTYQDLSEKFFFANKPIGVSLVKMPRKRATEMGVVDQAPEGSQKEKVRLDAHIYYQGRYYSVDEKYVGAEVKVTESKGRVSVFKEGKLIEAHPKITDPYQLHFTKPEHRGPWQRSKDKSSIYRQAAMRIGMDVDRFILSILERGDGFIDTQTIWGVLNFDKTYEHAAINEACKVALELETVTYGAVKMLLKLQGTRYEQKVNSGLQASK